MDASYQLETIGRLQRKHFVIQLVELTFMKCGDDCVAVKEGLEEIMEKKVVKG